MCAKGQPLFQGKVFAWGASWGIGGAQLWFRPALNLRYHQTLLYFSPIPRWLSLGAAQRVGHVLPRQWREIQLYVGLYGHLRYLGRKEADRAAIIQILAGGRYWLEPYLQRFYMQGGAGISLQFFPRAGMRVLPTAEIHIGGLYRRPFALRKYRRE
ncbi:MAG: hypothetical protein NZ580_01365 [Bacteroidia bacterium]|nr:hypothetical protein [Bacteroidia bacterium]MDW8235338.1 hypothetical protein [Bacteroidia bacterium]